MAAIYPPGSVGAPSTDANAVHKGRRFSIPPVFGFGRRERKQKRSSPNP